MVQKVVTGKKARSGVDGMAEDGGDWKESRNYWRHKPLKTIQNPETSFTFWTTPTRDKLVPRHNLLYDRLSSFISARVVTWRPKLLTDISTLEVSEVIVRHKKFQMLSWARRGWDNFRK